MIRRLLILVSLLSLVLSLRAQDQFILGLLDHRGNVKTLQETHFEQVNSPDNYLSTAALITSTTTDYDAEGQIVRRQVVVNDTLRSFTRFEYPSPDYSFEYTRDSVGCIQQVTKVFYKKGREYRRNHYEAFSFLWNLPSGREVKEYNVRGFLKSNIRYSRHGRTLSNVLYERGPKGKLLRVSVYGNSPKYLFNYFFHRNDHGDIIQIGYDVYATSETELLYDIDLSYDDDENWTKAVFYQGEQRNFLSVIHREYTYY